MSYARPNIPHEEHPLHVPVNQWIARAKTHAESVSPFTDSFVKRRDLGQAHPVHDFLFTYYTFSPRKLKQWVPQIDEKLEIFSELNLNFPWFADYMFQFEGNFLSLNKQRIHPNTLSLSKFILKLCENISNRPPRFSCFGLHEWAMVYQLSSDAVRHKSYRLRLSQEKLNEFVKSQKICCSHYDAYRFFTKEAKPLNVLTPILETRLEMEQGGCVHANMDLYKWSTKLWPWIGSDFIAKTFFLALEARELDMRASPYDLSDIGFAPICIETEKGRKEYLQEQIELAERAALLRNELAAFCKSFLGIVSKLNHSLN